MEVKGLCNDCLFLKQDWTVLMKKGQMVQELDWVCWLCDIFKNPDGYCDMWEAR